MDELIDSSSDSMNAKKEHQESTHSHKTTNLMNTRTTPNPPSSSSTQDPIDIVNRILRAARAGCTTFPDHLRQKLPVLLSIGFPIGYY